MSYLVPLDHFSKVNICRLLSIVLLISKVTCVILSFVIAGSCEKLSSLLSALYSVVLWVIFLERIFASSSYSIFISTYSLEQRIPRAFFLYSSSTQIASIQWTLWFSLLNSVSSIFKHTSSYITFHIYSLSFLPSPWFHQLADWPLAPYPLPAASLLPSLSWPSCLLSPPFFFYSQYSLLLLIDF